MSTVINQDYSAYYKGAQNVKKYTSNKTDPKVAASQHGTVTGATSKYSDDAVVEFSRGGMEALEESRQDIVESGSLPDGRRSFDEIMREHTPEVADQLDEYVRGFTRTGDKSYLLKFSRLALDWLHDNYSKHPEWFSENNSTVSTKTESVEKSTSTITAGEAGLSKKHRNF